MEYISLRKVLYFFVENKNHAQKYLLFIEKSTRLFSLVPVFTHFVLKNEICIFWAIFCNQEYFFFPHSLIEEGGDWDRRNRLKVYKGYHALTSRDFQTAATNFLESISTFTSYELMKYAKLVEYTILVSIISLKRAELGEKVNLSRINKL